MEATQAAMAHATDSLGYAALKEKQMMVVHSFIGGKDIFGVLPTGYGKSLCYACLAALLLRGHLVIVQPFNMWSNRGALTESSSIM